MIYIKRNDRRPAAFTTFTRGGSVVDLSTAVSVTFKMREFGKLDLKVNSAAVITDAVAGELEYRWSAGDTDTVGKYNVEWQVLWPDSTTETFPTIGSDILIVFSDLDEV